MFGKAVLGIAGAYLLRAVAESGTSAKLPLLIVAIVYAGMWLVVAVRTHAANHFASVTYAITAALILSPLLWESTVRFQVLSPVFSAAVLVAFVVLALALAWRQNLQAIPWVATLAAVITALVLIIATHELVPFTAGLLAVALATEVVVCLGRQLSVRAVPALAADFAVWLLVYVMTSPEGVPPEYRPTSATTITLLCLALLAIYGGSIGIRSFGLRYRLTIFEIVQGVVVFALATFGTLRASPGSAAALGAFFLLVAAVCYWGALSRFTAAEQARNRRVCATYAVALLLAGTLLLFPTSFQVPFLCLAAVTAAFLYMRTGKLSLGMHVSLYLACGGNLLWPSESGGERSGWNRTVLPGCRRVGGRSLRRSVLRNRMACFDRSMETTAALDRPLRVGGGRGGSAGGDGECATRFGERDTECFASLGCPNRGDLLGRSHPQLQRLAFETCGTAVGCVCCHSIGRA